MTRILTNLNAAGAGPTPGQLIEWRAMLNELTAIQQ